MAPVGDARALSAHALAALVARLGAGAPAEAHGAAEYESLRQALQQFFTWRGAHDAAACADETLDRVAARLAGGAEVERIRPFALGVARLVLHEEYRRIAAQPAPLVDREPPALEAQVGDDARAHCLDRCLASLPPADRELVLQYYAHDHRARIEGRAAIARGLGVTAETLRTRVQRLRNRLESCLRGCEREEAP